jgi:hypothetical protein
MSLIEDPGHWRRRADETRQLALNEHSNETKVLLELVAQSYDDLAVRAAARRQLQPAAPVTK